MKVKAKCNIKYGRDWIPCGTVIEVSDADYLDLKDAVDVVIDVKPEQPKAEAKEPDPVAAGTEETAKPKATPKPRRTSSTKK